MYEVNIENGDINWGIFYTLVNLRDVLTVKQEEKSVLHFFGGDYSIPWGKRPNHFDENPGESKVTRISKMVNLILKEKQAVHHHTGPLLLLNGKKLSKSKKNGPLVEEIPFELLDSIINMKKAIVDVTEL